MNRFTMAHSPSQMVEPIQDVEAIGVLLLPLGGLEPRQLPAHQRMHPIPDVHQHLPVGLIADLGDRLAQHRGPHRILAEHPLGQPSRSLRRVSIATGEAFANASADHIAAKYQVSTQMARFRLNASCVNLQVRRAQQSRSRRPRA
jgi:hypothetical protein